MEGNNKRIAKNTLFLYMRMLITMVVALYTSRVVLETLGVTDFGIYNVVGGVVSMLSFVTNSMASASQRFLAFEIGKNNIEKLKKTFSITITIYIIFAVIILIISETVGLWFVKNKLTIPQDRIEATLWVYQFSIFSFVFSILRIPYNAAIIAHEKMRFYALNSIVEVSLKLIIVLLLVWFSFDKLITYSFLTFLVILIISFIYFIYCRINFSETRYTFAWDKQLFKTMFGFAGWNLFDSIANVGKNEGVNILLNIFFNPAINAARGIAFQVSTQITGFVGNFQVAAAPQIIKYAATGQIQEMKKLYFVSSRLSYFLLFLVSLPIYLNLDFLLKLWLKEVPDYTLLFIQLILINRLVDTMAGTTNVLVQATGKMKIYQMFSGIAILFNLPISYLFLYFGFEPQITIIVSITLSCVIVYGRVHIMSLLTGIKINDYLSEVILRNIVVTFLSIIVPLLLYIKLEHSIWSFFIIGFTSVCMSCVSIYSVGLSSDERNDFNNFVIKKIKRNSQNEK